ncbi:cytochrome P450 2B11-like isoform X1 [Mustela putorius furo]|uniref:Cytochrome P450 2B11-like isoform X1 n=1 Tax=Mustela putorius furo TaxID=9669 RepID=M3Z1T4_MUSPF|nr:cytochrome P450 2B11-like isoform X1 [Mustela putorius furo]
MMLSTVLFLGVLIGLLLLWGHPTSRGCLPPGPWPLPFLGNILQIDHQGFLKTFQLLQKKYGEVFTVYLGPRPVVILCGYKAVKEALVDQAEAFSGRGHIAIIDPFFKGRGVAFAHGKSWKVLRQFSQLTMREFGMGKQSIEKQIQEEAQRLVEELQKSQGAHLDPTFFFHSAMANIICTIIFGQCFNNQDPGFLRLLHLMNDISDLSSSFYSQMFEVFSGILKYFPGIHRDVYSKVQEIEDFVIKNIQRHQEMLDPSAPKDFIDSFLVCMDKESSDPESEFHFKNLVYTVVSLFLAGTESSSNTLLHGFVLLLKNPDVVEKVQEEIDRVIGSHHLPALEDRAKMPYTDAVIHEIQRFSDILPLGVPRCVIKDTHFRGYHLPKGTTVYPFLSSVLHDPCHFEKPETFHPGHFLDAEGNFRTQETFIPFSLGRRFCLGESLARSELFLILTSVLQNFTLRSPKALEDIDITPRRNGLGKMPPEFQLCFLPRQGVAPRELGP